MYALGIDLFYEIVHHVTITAEDDEGLTSIDVLSKQAIDEITDDFKTYVLALYKLISLTLIRIFEEMFHADGGVRIGDEVVLCHTPILVGQSGELVKLLKKGSSHIELPEKYDLDADGFRAFLKFLYYE